MERDKENFDGWIIWLVACQKKTCNNSMHF